MKKIKSIDIIVKNHEGSIGGKMAVSKLRKQMKPVIWVITVAMFLSMILVGVSSLRSSMSKEAPAFKLNGKKISAVKVERSINGLTRVYSQYLGNNIDRELMSTIAFESVVEKELGMNIGKKMKIKVARSDVNTEYKKQEASIADKQQFNRMLQMQGYNVGSFKEEIKENLLMEKTLEKIKEDAKPSEEEVKEFFTKNEFGPYYGKTYDEVKEEITTSLQEQKGMEEYVRLIEKEKREMEITGLDSKYAAYEEKVELELDGFKFTNYDIAGRVLRNLFTTQGNKEVAEQMAKQSIEQEVKMAKVALGKGIETDTDQPVDNQLYDLRTKLIDKIRAEYKIDEAELEKYFEEKKLAYDVLPSVSANIAIFKVEPTEADRAGKKEEAEKLLTTVTPENFAEVAKLYSEGPSGPNGGDLGWFGKGQMVAPFEEAAFNTEVGTIYGEVVETQFGYHLIYVEEAQEDKVKARHILLKPEASDETVEAVLAEAKDAADRVSSGELKFEDLSKGENVEAAQLFEDISEGGYIPGLGYKDKLAKKIFAGEMNKAYALKSEGTIYVYEKVKSVEYKEANLEEMRGKVEYDFLNEKVQEEIGKIMS